LPADKDVRVFAGRKAMGIIMANIKIKDGIWSVGVINPNLRVFDIVMKTEYGTTYNSYLIQGEKNVLIDTVHHRFLDEYVENIESIIPITEIDYIVLNHTEPDHSGSLAEILKINPNITVIASAPAIKYLGAITNADFKRMTVKTGDKLDIGGMNLEFVTAPLLHWPDSMFVYIPEKRVVFTCDFLGCHYCEPRLLNNKVVYPKKYMDAFKYYYDTIMSPFKPFVLQGLAKLDEMDFDVICPSHGPVLVENTDKLMGLYREWSTKEEADKNVAILYVSAYGYTEEMAKELLKTLEGEGVKAQAYDIIEYEPSFIAGKINSADGVLIGSPTINRDALKPVWDTISSIDAINAKGKPFGVFGSYGWSGEAVPALCERLKSLGVNVLGEGVRANFKPSEEELGKTREYGKAFAELMRKKA